LRINLWLSIYIFQQHFIFNEEWSPTHDHVIKIPNKLDFSPIKNHLMRERASLNTTSSRDAC
jgi:hypothetical protein